MNKFLLLLLITKLALADIEGFWKSYDEKTKKIQMVVAVYPYRGKYFGRIIATYDKKGNLNDTLDNHKERAPGLVNEPFYCGLDLIYNLQKSGNLFKGKIVDPLKGNLYGAELWRKNQNLIVRGKLFFFGKSLTWEPFSEAEFSKEFPKPDVSKFVPSIPKVK